MPSGDHELQLNSEENYNHLKCNFTLLFMYRITNQKKSTGAGNVSTPLFGVILPFFLAFITLLWCVILHFTK